MDSQCKYGIVARGDASIYLRLTSSSYVENIWDHAAGVVIVKEAGGEVTDLEGKPLDWSHGKKLSHNKVPLHSQPVISSRQQAHLAWMSVARAWWLPTARSIKPCWTPSRPPSPRTSCDEAGATAMFVAS
jgi:hypothetical protein